MARISVKLFPYVGSDGRNSLCAMISHKTKTIKLKELASVKKADWDNRKKMIKLSSSDFRKEEIFEIIDKLDAYERCLRSISVNENTDFFTVYELREKILQECDTPEKDRTSVYKLINDYCELKMLSRKSRYSYETLEQKLRDFTGTEDIAIGDIDYRFLERFDAWMKSKRNKINTIAVNMRVLRTICNYAIREEILEHTNYPFKLYKIKTETTKHRVIEIDDLKKLIAYDGSTSENTARDLFMLSFYLRGMNMKDILYLQKKDLYKDRIYYSRSKTNADITVKIEPEAQAIFNKYKGTKYLLYFMQKKEAELKKKGIQRKSELHDDIVNKTTKNLKKIFNSLSINVNISTYFARHTWATIARKLFDYDIVQQGLGHVDGRVTAIYIKYDDDEIDAANRKVIDFVLQ